MGYRELLPQVDMVAKALTDAGVTPSQRQIALEAVGSLLFEHSEFHQYEYQRVGEKEDMGASQVLSELAEQFMSEGRYSVSLDQ